MSETLKVFGKTYTNVSGIKAYNSNDVLIDFIHGATANLQSKSTTPTESAQTITADTGYDGLSSVEVGAISSTYVGSGITQRSSSDLTVSEATVTVPSGYYSEQATKSVAAGTEGTPTAAKGTVSNHSVSVTPSVTNTTGYITGSTLTGTAVTVSASELVSGNLAIDQNGTGIDVTNYATVSVDIPEGSYIRTEIVAQQTFIPSSSQRRATLITTQGLVDNDYYIVTLDNVEWLTTCNLVWNVDYCLGDIAYIVSTGSIDSVYPFGFAWESGNEVTIAVGDTSQHTVKIEHLEFVDDPDVTLVTKTISANGTYNASSDSADGYSSVTVNVQPNLQSKTNISPTTSSQTITADNGYDGLSNVQINAMPSGSAATPATSITANPTISVNASGVVTATTSASKSITPSVSAGYVSSGTAGTVSVSGSNTYQLTTKAAATITPGTTNQTIAAGTYLTGIQTIAGDADLIASNILSGVSIFGVNGSVVIQKYYTGSSTPSSSLGSNGDIYLQQ